MSRCLLTLLRLIHLATILTADFQQYNDNKSLSNRNLTENPKFDADNSLKLVKNNRTTRKNQFKIVSAQQPPLNNIDLLDTTESSEILLKKSPFATNNEDYKNNKITESELINSEVKSQIFKVLNDHHQNSVLNYKGQIQTFPSLHSKADGSESNNTKLTRSNITTLNLHKEQTVSENIENITDSNRIKNVKRTNPSDSSDDQVRPETSTAVTSYSDNLYCSRQKDGYLSKFNETNQCPGPTSSLPNRHRKSRYLAFPEKANLVVTLNLLKATAFLMGLNTLHEVDIAFPLPRSLFVFEYETMHGPLRPGVKPPNQRVGLLTGLDYLRKAWNYRLRATATPTYYPGVPAAHHQAYRGRSANDRLVLLSQLESALQVFGLNGKKCILHLVCAARQSSGSQSLIHEIASVIFNRNLPEAYEAEDSECANYECNEMLHGLSQYLYKL